MPQRLNRTAVIAMTCIFCGAVLAQTQPRPSGHPTPVPTPTPQDNSGVRNAEARAAARGGLDAADMRDIRPRTTGSGSGGISNAPPSGGRSIDYRHSAQ